MDQDDIDIWLLEAMADLSFGFKPAGVNVHRHLKGYLDEETDFSVWENHELQIAQ